MTKKLMALALPLLLVAGCETYTESDRSMVEKANANAAAAQKQAMEAMDAAKMAAEAANKAAAAADRAAREAKMAGDKADRIFRKNLRK